MGWSKFKNTDFSKYHSMFVDRDEIINLFKDEYKKLKADPEYFKVISIYGIGGIGKTLIKIVFMDIIQCVLMIHRKQKYYSKKSYR